MALFRIIYTKGSTYETEAKPPEEVKADSHSQDGKWIVFLEMRGVELVQVLRIRAENVDRIEAL